MQHISITEWASILHARTSPGKLMMLLRAFFDESGLHETANVTVLAGFVGPSELLWAAFENDWIAKLKEFEELPYFHMTECITGAGVFSKWAAKPEIRVHIISEFCKIICKHKPEALWCSVYTGAWDELDAPLFKERFVTPYHFCFEVVLQQAVNYSRNRHNSAPLALVFSQQTAYKKRANEVYAAYEGGTAWAPLAGLAFADMRKCAPLQAPDMLAYELAKDLELDWAPVDLRGSVRVFLERIQAATNFPQMQVIYDLKSFQYAARELKENTGASSL